ncbi:MAG: energy transducer TonB [Betaproteobacteria bacterium]|nr:energy transducer TonB [Betaproteobacteria bacterium]
MSMIRKILRTPLTVFCACVLASCASKPGKLTITPGSDTTSYTSNGAVNAEIVVTPGVARYQVTPGVSFSNPEPAIENADPIYPAFLLAKRLDPVEVIARVIVNGAGTVDTATVVRNSSEEQAFADATLAAVKGWTFRPLKRTEGLVVDALPFTQEYRFTFRQVDGRAIVHSGARQ